MAVRASLVFASPAALVNVARTAGELTTGHRDALAGVRLLLSAGAPVPARLLRRLAAVVPNAEAHTPYGMTEVLPVADIDLATIEAVGPGEGVCVGHPVPGVEVAISPLDADGAATGALTTEPEVVGEVCVRAAHVKDRYDRLALTELLSSRDAGWHRSGDVGHLDADGRIWVEGRLAHLIRTADGVVTPVGVEQRVEDLPHIAMAAAVGVGPAGTQQVVVVVATDPAPGRPQLAPLSLVDRVRAVAGVDVAAVVAVPALPVDIRHQSKIDRERVAREVAARLAGRGLRRRRRDRDGGHVDGPSDDGRHDGAAPVVSGRDEAAEVVR
jgi:acyl-coenzyme A synthetase/AMP-(fatty) acid ligase